MYFWQGSLLWNLMVSLDSCPWIFAGYKENYVDSSCSIVLWLFVLQTGLTPLMEAASGGYVEVGRILLDKGGDVNAPPVPSSKDTALTIAADKGHYKFCDLLLSRGAMVDVKNKKGNSPLWLAANGM